jgi:dihydrofolate reductase
MRRVVLGLGISIDGYIARPNDAVDFLFMPKDYSMGPFMKSVDTAILGRKTMDAALKMGGSFSAFPMTYYVFSRSQAPGMRDGVIFVDELPSVLIERLRRQPGKNIWLMGGGELAREFLKADLVDDLEIGVVPVLLGAGIPLFPSGFPERQFELVETKTYSRGLLTLKYKRATPTQKRAAKAGGAKRGAK